MASGKIVNHDLAVETLVSGATDVDGVYFSNKRSNVTIYSLSAYRFGKVINISGIIGLTGTMVADNFYELFDTALTPYAINRVPAIGHNSAERGDILGNISLTSAGTFSFAPETGGSDPSTSKTFRIAITYITSS